MKKFRKVIVVGAVALAAVGLRTLVVRYTVASAKNAPLASDSARTLAHLDHSPRHGGLVLMDGDTHFEVVLDNSGGYGVYFSDGVRAPLPASFASQVRIAVIPIGRSRETIALKTDSSDSRWIGRGTPINDPNTVLRIGYTANEKPYWIDVPASAWPSAIAPLPQ